MECFRRHCLFCLLELILIAPWHIRAEEPRRGAPSAAETVIRVDAALIRSLGPGAALPVVVDDAAFLRRVSLDLTGKLPDLEALHRFVSDAARDKRAKVVDDLLKDESYAVNWGRYWRDTVTYHTPASANY